MSSLVLVVDDELINREIIGSFVSHTGRRICLAASGAQALELAAAQRFDLILMDIRLGAGMSGLEAARHIRATAGPCRFTLILALTVNDSAEKARACLAAGMDGVIIKPISYEALSSALNEWDLGGTHGPGA